jgi:hypothetical protein
MKIIALCSLLIASVISASSAQGKEVPKFTGAWVWVIKQSLVNQVVIVEDGNCYATNVNVKGRWRILSDTKCIEFKWDNGFTDTLSFAKSQQVLVGINNTKDMIIAAKLP